MLLPPAASTLNRRGRSLPHSVTLQGRLLASRGADPAMLRELSMGMSHDFEVAIEEGATMIRVGTAIFGRDSGLSRRVGPILTAGIAGR